MAFIPKPITNDFFVTQDRMFIQSPALALSAAVMPGLRTAFFQGQAYGAHPGLIGRVPLSQRSAFSRALAV
jgi:hypothetical protein